MLEFSVSGKHFLTMVRERKALLPGPYAPTLILHGGAGNITRKNLPPSWYNQYESSLLRYLGSTRQLLDSGASALDAAVHAVSLMEDDPLFNCGRGSVFTEKGTIEMEASVMVASLNPDRVCRDEPSTVAAQKRAASVSLVKETRHPIQLATEVLLVRPNGKAGSMHCQLSGPDVEQWGWKERGLERKDHGWFWTERRWAEHLRGLEEDHLRHWSRSDPASPQGHHNHGQTDGQTDGQDSFIPSQGTVGAVCMDSWGDVAVATSTGGLTNKKAGRIGDTPTVGAGFWAESWEESVLPPISGSKERAAMHSPDTKPTAVTERLATAIDARIEVLLQGCFPHTWKADDYDELPARTDMGAPPPTCSPVRNIVKDQPHAHAAPQMHFQNDATLSKSRKAGRRRVIAVSGTGNGDTFLRTVACRTIAAISRYSTQNPESEPIPLATAMSMIAGPNGEMQKSAGDRWGITGEGQAGMIGIEVCSEVYGVEKEAQGHIAVKEPPMTGRVVFDFNCGGLWRAWIDDETGEGKVMAFRQDYY